tara:strand:- start:294 stop:464 length:171 start_codon:yes stop_codon:yes gene_type:complete
VVDIPSSFSLALSSMMKKGIPSSLLKELELTVVDENGKTGTPLFCSCCCIAGGVVA